MAKQKHLVALSLLLLITACAQPASSGSPSPSSVGSPTAAAARQLHFYVVDSLTGPAAPFGTRTAGGTTLAAKVINDGGGFTDSCGNRYDSIRITTQDIANAPEQAITLLRQAAADRTVLGVIGPTSSVGYVPVVPVAGELGIPLMGIGSGAVIKVWNPYAYQINVVPAVGTPLMMQALINKLQFKRIAIIYDIQQDGNRTDAELIRDLAPKMGYQVVAFTSFRTGDPDLRAQLTTIKAANPDLIAMNMPGEDLARGLNQAAELGLGETPKLTGFSQFDNPVVWDLSSGKAKGGYSWAPGVSVSSPDPAIRTYVALYKAQIKDDATKESLYANDALGVFVDAVKRSCTATDRKKFNDELRKTNHFQGLANLVTFGPDDGLNKTSVIRVIQTVDRGLSVEVK